MALMAHGRPVVTTCGPLTEGIWRESKAAGLAPAGEPGKVARMVVELARDEARAQAVRVGRDFALRPALRHPAYDFHIA